MTHHGKKLNLSTDSLAALVLIVLQTVFLLVNFNIGFNLWLYIIVAVITLLFSFIKPRAGLFALITLTLIFAKHFTLQSLWLGDEEYKLYLVDIFLLAILGRAVLELLAGKIKWQIRKVDVWLGLFLALTIVYFLLSWLVWNGSFNLAFSSLKNYFFYPLLFWLALFWLDSKEHLHRLFKFVMAGSVIIIGFIAYGLITGQGLWTEITPLSTFGSRILDFDHAFYLCLVSLFGLSYVVIKQDRWAKWWQLLLFIFAIGIIGSLMRHLWIALAVGLVVVYVLARQQRQLLRQVAVKYLAIAAMILAAAFFLAINLPNTQFSQESADVQYQLTTRATSLADSSDTSIAWRRTVWQGAWKEYKNNLTLGLGFGQKIFIDMGDYRDYVEVRNIHNSWLAIFVQMGLLGFVVLIIFLLLSIKQLLQQKLAEPDLIIVKIGVASSLAFCLVAFLFQPYLEANFFNIIFWLNLGLGRRLYEGITS